MTDIRFLTIDEVIEIQKRTLPNSGSPHMDKLEGALGRIDSHLGYGSGNVDLFTIASIYLVSISQAHAFNDANKRTAFQAACVFLLMNKVVLLPSVWLVKLTILAAIGDADIESTATTLKVLSNYKNELLQETHSGYN
ncbi:type II toxin-antitoxin system death-on-curing family toxin [Providencia rettgeri]|nr:type II toxin-antitoxin system death-on-curing family toxin [Providencia rettgeri]ELR5124817.1 type II toxin-antitoxin system death-on-curing family toxin [Providencia rettgeri]ELR5244707.1 type II toxin-antitoxin system death-on-curing family toxin [Providencia rettgeri]ELS4583008.1 type II toxin-antitoxin system death-on-curing family toxin [Providencia rettgeri]